MKNKNTKKNLQLKIIIALQLFILGCSKTSQTDAASAAVTANDSTLSGIITANGLTKLSEPTTETTALILLGETLFSDVALSGARDTSCLSCHSTTQGSVDGLPFSVGTGATGIGSARKQLNGISSATPRNSPALYNLGRSNQVRAFLDGRVGLANQIITSTVSEISGTNPSRSDIKNIFTNVYDVQPMFPLLSAVEMLGTNNTLSSHVTDIAIWQSILTDRLLSQTSYVNLFAAAYPTTTLVNLNPGHIGRAIGAFLKIRFKSNSSPFDNYVSGNLTALTENQKQGMILFYTKGQCVRCHSGSNFTDLNFHSVGVPQIGLSPFTDDLGLGGSTNLAADNYKFKTPSLRNLSLTAPYMHNGAFETIEAVVTHYINISASQTTYQIPASYQSHYEQTLVLDTNTTRNLSRFNQIDNQALKSGLNFSTQDKANLVDFLTNGLRDPNFN